MTNIKLILKTERINHGYKQIDIAKYLNIEQAAYSKYETGRTIPTPENFTKLANLYDVPVDYLMGTDIATILRRSYDLGKSKGEIIGDNIKLKLQTKKEKEIEK